MTYPADFMSARRPAALGFATLLLLLVGLGSWSATTRLSAAIVASGRVDVARFRHVVEHPDGGVADLVAVEEGSEVEAGDLLIRLEGTYLRSELARIGSERLAILARRARLQAEQDDAETIGFPEELLVTGQRNPEVAGVMASQRRLFLVRLDAQQRKIAQLGEQREQLTLQVKGIEEQLNAQVLQIALLDRELATQQTLYDKGLAKMGGPLAIEREKARLRGVAGELAAARRQAEARKAETYIEIGQARARRREDAMSELQEVNLRERELSERYRVLSDRVSRLDITAPVAGTVFGLSLAAAGSVAKPAEPLLYLMPRDRPFVVAAQVPTTQISGIFVDQPARIRFSSLAAAGGIEVSGKVGLISAAPTWDESGRKPYYRVEIILDAAARDLLPQRPLPEVPVEVFFLAEDRTVLGYLLRPLSDRIAKAFREP